MTLEKVTQVAVLVVCCAMLGDLASRHLGVGARGAGTSAAANGGGAANDGSRRTRPPEYNVGEAFPAIEGFAQEPDKGSLLLVVRKDCIYCEKSVPFYQQLAKQARAANSPVQLVGVCLEPTDTCGDYFKGNDIAVDLAVAAPGGIDRITGTPTVVKLNKTGKVESIWLGTLAPERQKAVLSAVLQPKATPAS